MRELPASVVFEKKSQLSGLLSSLSDVGIAVGNHLKVRRQEAEQERIAKERDEVKAEQARRDIEVGNLKAQREEYDGYNRGLAVMQAKAADTNDPSVVVDYLSGFKNSDNNDIATHSNNEYARVVSGVRTDIEQQAARDRTAKAQARAEVLKSVEDSRQVVTRASSSIDATVKTRDSAVFNEIYSLTGADNQRVAIYNMLKGEILKDPETQLRGFGTDTEITDPSVAQYMSIRTNELFNEFQIEALRKDRADGVEIRTAATETAFRLFSDNPNDLVAALFVEGGVYDVPDASEAEREKAIDGIFDLLTNPDHVTNGEQLHDAIMRARDFDVALNTYVGPQHRAKVDARVAAIKNSVEKIALTYTDSVISQYGQDRSAHMMIPDETGLSPSTQSLFKFWTDAGGTIDPNVTRIVDLRPLDYKGEPNAYLEAVKNGLLDAQAEHEKRAELVPWYKESKKSASVSTPSSHARFIGAVREGNKPNASELQSHLDVTAFGSLTSPVSIESIRESDPETYGNVSAMQTTLATQLGISKTEMLNVLNSEDPDDYSKKVEIFRAAATFDQALFGQDYPKAMATRSIGGLLSDDPDSFASSMGYLLSTGGVSGYGFTSALTNAPGLSERDRTTAIAVAIVAQANYSKTGVSNLDTWAAISNLRNVSRGGSLTELAPGDTTDARVNAADAQAALKTATEGYRSNVVRALQEATGHSGIEIVNGIDDFKEVLPKIAADYIGRGMSVSAAWTATMTDMKTAGFAMAWDETDKSLTVFPDPHKHWIDQPEATKRVTTLADSVPATPFRNEMIQALTGSTGDTSAYRGKSFWELYRTTDARIPELKNVDLRVNYLRDQGMLVNSQDSNSVGSGFFMGGGIIQWRPKNSPNEPYRSIVSHNGRPFRWSGHKDYSGMFPISKNTTEAAPKPAWTPTHFR
jgi:hypothetical protein